LAKFENAIAYVRAESKEKGRSRKSILLVETFLAPFDFLMPVMRIGWLPREALKLRFDDATEANAH
jgi:hypothetical protein